MSRGYFDHPHSQTATPVISNGSRIQDSHKVLPADFIIGSSNAGGETALNTRLSSNFGLSRPLSSKSSGDSDMNRNRLEKFDESNSFDFSRLGSTLTRSRSAQPSSMHDQSMFRPPPGLTSSDQLSIGNDTFSSASTIGRGLQRPASTGVLSGRQESILRPASKTLMDLIQEDYPEDNQRASNRYDEETQVYDRRSNSPAITSLSPSRQHDGGLVSNYEQTNTEHRNERHNAISDAYHARSHYNASNVGSPSPQPHFVNNNAQQRASSDYQPGSNSSVQSMSTYHQFPSIQQHIIGQRQPGLEQHFPDQKELNIQQLISQHQLGGQNQFLFNDPLQQQRTDSNVIHHQSIQTGQTVYVSAPGTQPGYGYTTIQYQPAGGPQAHLVHQSIPNGFNSRGDQFVSIVPIQGNGHQLAYWQSDQGQSLGSTVTFVNAHSSVGAPMVTSRLDGNNQHYGGGRHGRNDKGGRGRRGQQVRRGDSSKTCSHSYSSPLLEEFRSSKSRDWTLRRIEGYVLEFCQDQNGSRFIQQRLELGDPVEQQIVMKEVLPAIRRLRNDVFGNYVVQKLLDFGTPEMKADIRKTLEGEMLQLSLQMYGCRVVQKSLETLQEEDLPHIMLEFHHNVLSCIHDQNGNHVIQKCIEVMNARAKKSEAAGDPDRAFFLREQIDFIVNDVLVNTASLSCHPYGCRVLQRILEHCDEQKKELVLDEIKKHHQKLLDDQYGNYVIQHVLQFGRDSDRDSILHIIQAAGLLGLSRQKFASNVVEKLLKHGNGSQRRAIAREMLHVSCTLFLSAHVMDVTSYTLCYSSLDC